MYEEKERSWERELRKIKALYENRMKANQQKVTWNNNALMIIFYSIIMIIMIVTMMIWYT